VCESERDVDGGREGRNAEPETSTGFCISVWCLERERERGDFYCTDNIKLKIKHYLYLFRSIILY